MTVPHNGQPFTISVKRQYPYVSEPTMTQSINIPSIKLALTPEAL